MSVGPADVPLRRLRPQPPAEYLEKSTANPPDEPQYEGVVSTDGTVALRWRTAYRSTSLWASYNDFYRTASRPDPRRWTRRTAD
jgi:hypothetical protein